MVVGCSWWKEERNFTGDEAAPIHFLFVISSSMEKVALDVKYFCHSLMCNKDEMVN